MPLYDADNTILASSNPYTNLIQPLPVHKIYNISLSDPLGNHSTINKIYEDVLPSDKITYSFIKLNERESIKNFMRNSILDKHDGEELSLKGGDKSLLSWLKIYDLNPYSLVSNVDNPYNNLPHGFLLYRSAYPIRYNEKDHVLKTTPTSMAYNLRIYKLSVGALTYKNNDCFDVWRDLKYYKWVNKIIKQKISPNFLNYILYVFDKKSSINFKDLDTIKKDKDTISFQENNNKLINTILNINDKEKDEELIEINKYKPRDDMPMRKVSYLSSSTLNNGIAIVENEQVEEDEPNISLNKNSTIDFTKDSEKILVIITDAPNSNIIKWNSKNYQKYGTRNKMIATGYHKPEVWYSILFQLIYACAVMHKENIYFNNFSLENNVFIKDIQTDNTGNSCWVYKINNIEYYVPNYGYILVIDSNYVDIKSTELMSDKKNSEITKLEKELENAKKKNTNTEKKLVDLLNKSENTEEYKIKIMNIIEDYNVKEIAEKKLAQEKIQYKIYGDQFDYNNSTLNELKTDFKKTLINELSPDKFTSNKANLLDDDVERKIKQIHDILIESKDDNSIFKNIFENCFINFVNNKVGKTLTKLEKENLNLLARPDYRLYAVMVRQKRYDEYDWVVFVKNDTDKKQKYIICKDSNNLEIKKVFHTCLYSYPENILPEDKTILETYTFP